MKSHDNSRVHIGEHTTGHIARSGKPKDYAPTNVAQGMTEQQRKMTGMGHPIQGAPDASSSNALDPTVMGKKLSPVKVHPSMRGADTPSDADLQTLGQRMLQQAVRNK
jgi:hypothetical protein